MNNWPKRNTAISKHVCYFKCTITVIVHYNRDADTRVIFETEMGHLQNFLWRHFLERKFPWLGFSFLASISLWQRIRTGVPMGHGLVPGHKMLGMGLHSSKWATGKQVKVYLCFQPLLINHTTAWALPPVRSVAAWSMLCTWIILKPPLPPKVHGKTVLQETAPWCQKVGDHQTRKLKISSTS